MQETGDFVVLTLHIHVRLFAQQKLRNSLPIFPATCHHQRRPARPILGVYVHILSLREEFDNREVVVGYGPVEREAVVGVSKLGQLRVGSEKGFDYLGWEDMSIW